VFDHGTYEEGTLATQTSVAVRGLGEHTDGVLRDVLGPSDDEIAALGNR
jgi:hypothetical protein